MRSRASVLFLASACLGACVPQGKYDDALKDAQKAHADLASAQAERDKCKDQSKDQSSQDAAELARMKQQSDSAQSSQAATAAELEELRKQKAAAEARVALFNDFVKRFKSMIDAGHIKIATRRGRIVLQLKNDVLFDRGKTEIKPEGKKALTEIAQGLRSIAGRTFQVAGHTDGTPIKTKEFASNWELSTARAVEVVKLLVASGVNPAAVSASGYGEFDPVASNASADGQAKNRRIEITLQPNVEELIAMPGLKE
jgi:chemotaxis protein MotB